MTRNKLFGLRLSPEIISSLESRFPGKPTVESIRLILAEYLGLQPNTIEMDGRYDRLEDFELRIQRLEMLVNSCLEKYYDD